MKTYYGQPVSIVCAIRDWCSLGITPDNPQMALRSSAGKIITTAQAGSEAESMNELTRYADQHYLLIVGRG